MNANTGCPEINAIYKLFAHKYVDFKSLYFSDMITIINLKNYGLKIRRKNFFASRLA